MRQAIFLLLLPWVGLAQPTINADQFFALGLSNFKQIEKSTTEEVHFPWIDRYEFRTETRDFDFDEQEYTFRVTPSTAKIRNAQKNLFEEMRNKPDFEGQEIYCDYVFSLHNDWLSLLILSEHIDILHELEVLLQDKQSVYEKMLGTYEFAPERLVKLRTERSDLEISLNRCLLEKDFLLDKYNLQNQEIDFNNFITIEAISAYLTNDIPSLKKAETVDLEIAHKQQLLSKEIELESSEKKQLIDFVQFRYNGPHSDAWRERLSVGLGFQLSTSGNRKLKMQELQIEQEELKQESKRNIREKQEKLILFEKKLQGDIQAYFHLQKIAQEERGQLQTLSTKIAQKEGSSPLVLLDIEERHLRLKLKALNNKEDLIRDYLEYLRQSDTMCQPTFINYLIR